MNDWPRTDKDKPEFLRTVGACSIPDYSHFFALCCLFVVNPRRTHGRGIVSHPAAVERGQDFIVENVGKPRNIKGCRLRAFPIRREPDNQPL